MHTRAVCTSDMHWAIELPAMTTAVPTPFKLWRHHKSHQIVKMPKQSQNSTILDSIHVSRAGGEGHTQTNILLFNILNIYTHI